MAFDNIATDGPGRGPPLFAQAFKGSKPITANQAYLGRSMIPLKVVEDGIPPLYVVVQFQNGKTKAYPLSLDCPVVPGDTINFKITTEWE